jgi:hypothetical protein
MFGEALEGLPDEGQIGAMTGVIGALGSDLVFVGEPNGGDWQIAGKLLQPNLRADVDGHARVVGKVSSQWRKGAWKSLLALPGMNLMNREQRRKLESEGPKPGQEDNWLEGPALMLDVLAIYR